MRRTIERLLENPIAEAILRGDFAPGHNSVAVRNKKTDAIEFQEVLPAKPRPKRKPAPKAKKETKSPRKK